jgi:3'-phosphoadenosine 5'-phosphosulfate sulfotransferase (PAPS reductase)/FAD synthetase
MKFHGQVYISFSGGKDSTVLLHLVRQQFPDVPAVFVDTGLEYPEIRKFVKTIDNVIWIKPKYTFKEVLEKYGYPIISKDQSYYIYQVRHGKSKKLNNIRMNDKRYGISPKWKYLLNAPFKIASECCKYLKKNPLNKYEKESDRKPFVGIMAEESRSRQLTYVLHGCNAFDLRTPQSRPLIFWKESDIWEYIKLNNIKYSDIYNKGIKRTGCIFCCYGVHREKRPNKFDILKKLHPKLYNYCMNDLGIKKVLKYINVDMDKDILKKA